MPTPPISLDLRAAVVSYYTKHDGATYESTAAIFGIGPATVNRLLRLFRETGGIAPIERPKKPKNKIDLTWLRAHAEANPNDRLKDRVEAFARERSEHVSITSMWYAMRAVGFTHKKRRSLPKSAIRSASN